MPNMIKSHVYVIMVDKCYFSGSSTSVKSNSEHKQLPMKTDSCLDILKSSKPPVGEKTVEDSTQSKPPAPSVCSFILNTVF